MTMVYIIEDDPWQSEYIARTLHQAGYTSKQFTNGIEAIEAIDTAPPDAIILDMLLTATTGVTLLHELQSYTDTGAIPVIVCSGLADDIRLEELQPYGVRRILDKTTMEHDDVITAVRSVL